MRRHESRSFTTLFQKGFELQQQGRLREAVDYYRRAIGANGTIAEAHNNLGCAYLDLGQSAEAAAAFEKAIALKPQYAAALDNLGLARGHLADPEAAIAFHQRAVAADPTNVTLQVHLGNAFVALQRYDEARNTFEGALRIAPDDAAVSNGLGLLFDRLGHNDEAEFAFRAALEADPQFGIAAGNLGTTLLNAGDIDGAAGWFERALALDPHNSRFYFYLALSRLGAVDDRQLAAMEQLAANIDDLPAARRIDLRFALAKAYEARERYDEAFQQLLAGNALKRAATPYDEAETFASFSLLEAGFVESFVAPLRGSGNPSTRPIFVFGMPRSGTTLVEQLLAAQPSVATAGEIPTLADLAKDFWQAIAAGISPDGMRDALRSLGDRYIRATDRFAENLAHVTDKMPGNFTFAPLIHLALPNARMIHVRRDRLDTCVSCFSTLFDYDSVSFSYDLGELGRYYDAYEAMMASWRALLPADRFIEVHYERLVDDFEAEARRLLAFCELPWDARTLAFHQVRRTVRTASNVQVRQPLYRTAIGRSEKFATYLAPLLETP